MISESHRPPPVPMSDTEFAHIQEMLLHRSRHTEAQIAEVTAKLVAECKRLRAHPVSP